MRYFPIHLDVQDAACLLVGGGRVGVRKARTLMACGARLVVVAPAADPVFHQWQGEGRLVLKQRHFDAQDVMGMRLVIAATDQETVNQEVCMAARENHIWCNAAQNPDQGDFILPSVVDREGLTLTISTHGNSPALARYLRQKLEAVVGPEYNQLATILGHIRSAETNVAGVGTNFRDQFELLMAGNLLGLLREHKMAAAQQLIDRVCGPQSTPGFKSDDGDVLDQKG